MKGKKEEMNRVSQTKNLERVMDWFERGAVTQKFAECTASV